MCILYVHVPMKLMKRYRNIEVVSVFVEGGELKLCQHA